MIGTITSGDGCVLIASAEFDRLRAIEERAEMKIRQLEGVTAEGPAGLGDTAHRDAYVRALRFAIGVEFGKVLSK